MQTPFTAVAVPSTVVVASTVTVLPSTVVPVIVGVVSLA